MKTIPTFDLDLEGFKIIQFNREYTTDVIFSYIEPQDGEPETEEGSVTWDAGDREEANIIEDHGDAVDIQFGDGSMVFGLSKNVFDVVDDVEG